VIRQIRHDLTCPYCGGALELRQRLEHQPSRAVDTFACLHRECRREWAYVRQLALLRRNNGCGTDNGYQAHIRSGVTPCDACKTAHNDAGRVRRERRATTTA
jgi:hypothetical protein